MKRNILKLFIVSLVISQFSFGVITKYKHKKVKAKIPVPKKQQATLEELNQQLFEVLKNIVHWQRGKPEELKHLLAAGANPNMPDDFGNTALIIAIVSPDDNITKMLLAAGANPNQTNKQGLTPLTFAAQRGDSFKTRLLLTAGADPNKSNNFGETPLKSAISVESALVVQMLLAAGADPNLTDYQGWKPIHLTFEQDYVYKSLRPEERPNIAKMLLSAGADPNLANPWGELPLLAAIKEFPNLETIKIMLAAGASPTQRNKKGENFFSLMNNIPEIENFIKKVLRPSKDLQTGAQKGKIDIMRNALKDGALINMPDENGNTPLHLAIMNRNLDAVKYLLQFAQSINFSLKNNEGQTVLDLATTLGLMDIIKLIQQATIKK